MPTPDTPKTSSFPYKTLIWASIALIAMFLFKGEFKSLLSRADEVAIFGIELKVGKEQAAKLEAAINSYKDKMLVFDKEITDQQRHIKKLEILKKQLENDLASCPGAKEKALLLNTEFQEIYRVNTELQKQSDVLRNTKILQKLKASNMVPRN